MGCGIVFLALVEWGWITTQGLTIPLSQRAMEINTQRVMKAEFRAWGPSLRRQLDAQLQVPIDQQTTSILEHLSISVDGVDFGVPIRAQQQLQRRLARMASQELDRYVQSQMQPSKIVQTFFRPRFSHRAIQFQFQVDGVVIPVTVHVK